MEQRIDYVVQEDYGDDHWQDLYTFGRGQSEATSLLDRIRGLYPDTPFRLVKRTIAEEVVSS